MEKHHILNIGDVKDVKVLDENRRTFTVGGILYMFQGEVNASGYPKGVGTLYKEVSEYLNAHLAPGIDYALAYHGTWTRKFALNGKGWYKNKTFTVQGIFRTTILGDKRQFYFHNTATVKYNTGDKFEGKLTKGMQLDVGLYTYTNGTTYRGTFHTETRKTHYGAYVSNDPKDPSYTYTGNFVKDKKDGMGALVFPNGDCFNGEFKEDKPKTGVLGIFRTESTLRYEGPVDDKFRPHGLGKACEKYTSSEEKIVMDGEFQESKFIRGKRIHMDKNNNIVEIHDGSWNGKKFEGTVKTTVDGQVTVRQGRFGTSGHIIAGIYTHANGMMYIGKFHDGKATGKGIQIHKNGDVYSGEWKQDKKNGDFVVWTKQARDEDGFAYKRSEVVFEKDTKKTTKSAVLKRKKDFDDFVRTQKRVCMVA